MERDFFGCEHTIRLRHCEDITQKACCIPPKCIKFMHPENSTKVENKKAKGKAISKTFPSAYMNANAFYLSSTQPSWGQVSLLLNTTFYDKYRGTLRTI